MKTTKRSSTNGKASKTSPVRKTQPSSSSVKNGGVKKSPKNSQRKPSQKQTTSTKAKPKKQTMNKKIVQVANGLSKAISNGKQPEKAAPKKPPKFSYVVDGLLAGMGRPTQHGHMQFLCDNGFKYLVTLTLNKPRAILEYPGEGLEWVHIPIQDETPPSVEQITKFVTLVDKAKAEKSSVAVHCAWGRGRTGTMLASYLAKTHNLSVKDAIEGIRRLRPGSIDTEAQQNSLRLYIESLKR